MKYRIILSLYLFFCISLNVSALNLSAEVDRTEIATNESLRLIVTADEKASDTIDFSEVLLQFDILNTQRNSQTSIVNGQVSSNTQWMLILSPKESGKLTIPSFEYRGVYSQAITITVDDSSNSVSGIKDRDVFLQVSVDKNELYVQEQLLVTMRLYYKTALSSYDDESLQLENTTVTLVSENNFQTKIKGNNYKVLEKIYAIHPQSSEELKIPAQSWRLEKALPRFSIGRSGNPYLYVRSDALSVTVNPIADQSTASTWLPSSEVTLTGEWQQSILKAKVGEPLNYQLAIIANGLTAAQLPNITLQDTNQFTIYAEQADIKDTKSEAGIIGTRVNNFAIIPRTAGTFTFPETSIKWWNIDKNREEVAHIPEQTIVVASSDLQTTNNLPSITEQPKVTSDKPIAKSSALWKWLTATFALTSLLLGFFLYRVLQQRKIISANTQSEAQEPRNKNSIRAISHAAQKQDWQSMRQCILQWGEIVSGNKLSSLSQLSLLYPELQLDLEQLDNKLYGTRKDDAYNPEGLLQKIKSIKKLNKAKKSKTSPLTALYKN